MNDKMWNIFEKTGNIEAYLYIEESKRLMSEVSDELTYSTLDNEEKKDECRCNHIEGNIS